MIGAMTSYGGLGGVEGGRALNPEDRFEVDVAELLGDRLRASSDDCCAMWSALANVDWRNQDGDEAGYSYRAAGDLIAAVLEEGDYMDWYCSGPDGIVAEWIAEALANRGWTPIHESEGAEGRP